MSELPNLQKKWAPGAIRAYVMLMVEFLRLSPSYALATEIANANISPEKQRQLIIDLYERGSRKPLTEQAKTQALRDFEKISQTQLEFGDLVSTPFEAWWNTTGIELFGLDQAPPRVQAVSKLSKGTELDEPVVKQIRKYFAARKDHYNPPALLVSIPLGIPKRMQMRLISKLLEKYTEELPIKSANTSRPLAVQRLRRDPLEKGIHLLWLHARHPDLKLWQLGAAAKVSKTYSGRLDAIDSRPLSTNEDDRNSLTVLTHRMLTRAQLIAENAAHGVFPSYEKRPLPAFDTDSVYKRMIKYKPNLKRR